MIADIIIMILMIAFTLTDTWEWITHGPKELWVERLFGLFITSAIFFALMILI